jgi:hypothetical protein
MLRKFISDYLESDLSRSNKSNLIKLLVSDRIKFSEIDNFINFGTFKQKMFHYMEETKEIPKCLMCDSKVNWVEKDFRYRETCSSKCSGKLNLFRKSESVSEHPKLTDKNEYYDYFKSNRIKITVSSISKHYPEILEKIESIGFSDDFNQKVYCYLKDMTEIPLCKNCNENEVPFENFSQGYRDYCSVKCSSNSKEKKERIKLTNMERYGVPNPSPVTRDKALETMTERYGSHISNTESYKEKYEKTSISKYGVSHPFQSEEIKDKISKKMVERYGVTKPLMNLDLMKKSLKTREENGHIFKWSEEDLKLYENYRRKVTYLSDKNYQANLSTINPENLERGHTTYHLDHIYPVILGFINKIEAELISHPKNLQILPHLENRIKHDRTDMTLDDFYNLIRQ